MSFIGEDEENCPANRASCSSHEFRCRSDGNCMPMEKYCDGKKILFNFNVKYLKINFQ